MPPILDKKIFLFLKQTNLFSST